MVNGKFVITSLLEIQDTTLGGCLSAFFAICQNREHRVERNIFFMEGSDFDLE